jgi:hypothetical protein
MQPFPPSQPGVVQCPHCGGCSVPSAPLPLGTVVACPTCRQSFVYQPSAYQPNVYGANVRGGHVQPVGTSAFPTVGPTPSPSYASPLSQPLGRTLPSQDSGDQSQTYILVGVGAAGLLIAVLLVTLLISYQAKDTPVANSSQEDNSKEVGSATKQVEPQQSTPASSTRESYPATSFWTPPTHEEARKQVEAELARLKRKGEPVTLEELQAFHNARPLANNTSVSWLAAVNDVQASGPARGSSDFMRLISWTDKPLDRSQVRSDEITEMAGIIWRAREQLDRVVMMGDDPRDCRFSIAFEDKIAAKLDHASNVRYTAQLLAARVRVQLLRSQHEELHQNLLGMLSLIRTLDEGVMTIEHLARASTIELTCRSIADTIQNVDLSAEELEKLAVAIADVEIFQRALRGATGMRVIGLVACEDGPALLRSMERTDVELSPIASARDRAFFLGFQAKLLDARRADPWKGLDMIDALERDLRALGKLSSDARDNYAYSRLICEHDCDYARVLARTEAIRLLTLAALRIRAFQTKNNRLPTSLAECGVPTSSAVDPFDGRPLRSQASDKSFLVYSIGVDRRDGGGKVFDLARKPDLGVLLKHPRSQ